MLKTKLSLVLIVLFSLSGFSQQPLDWKDISNSNMGKPLIKAKSYRTVSVDFDVLKTVLLGAPSNKNTTVRASDFIFQIPNPDGELWSFRIVEASIMAPELQMLYPEIRTFKGQGIGAYSGATIRIDFTLKGFHAQVIIPGQTYYIDPFNTDDLDTYIVYTRDAFYALNTQEMEACEPIDVKGSSNTHLDYLRSEESKQVRKSSNEPPIDFQSLATNGTQLRTYQLALACTGEYAQYQGGTTALALSAMTTTMNRVNGVFEREMSLTMELVANTSDLIYLSGSTDPYSNNNSSDMLGENQINCDLEIGSSNYDIGHVFSTGGGGVAYLRSPCNSAFKAKGVTGTSSPVGDPFDIDYVAHEMGHQFGANHTFNNSCSGNRNGSTAYEPGSASTIMGYSGICPPNLQIHSDDYFHNISFNEMYNFTVTGSGSVCATTSSTGNTPPTVSVPSDGFYIPIETPFELTGAASDADDDALTYCWEEFDLGSPTAFGDTDLSDPSGNAPIFRSWNPTTNPTRVFPRLFNLVNNTSVIGELLPTYTRELTFRLTVRDNAADGGGVTDAEVAFHVTSSSGPFEVLTPNVPVSWNGNTSETVTWDVANTNAAPVNCSQVDILLSVDGGYTYPYTLMGNTDNDGIADVFVPNIFTSTARIKVKASDNIFFDISNQDFNILPGAEYDYNAALISIDAPSGEICGSSVIPQITIANFGVIALTSLEIHSNIDGGPDAVFNWTGSLSNSEFITISLASIPLTTGTHVLNVSLMNPNGQTDQVTINDTDSQPYTANLISGEALPATNNFENAYPGLGWIIDNPDNEDTWTQFSVSNDVNCQTSNTARINNYLYSDIDQIDDLISPWIDLSTASLPELTFDYAYARFNDFYNDRMQVQILSGCSDTWVTVWDKENLELTTAGSTSSSFVPACGDWSSQTIDLSDYIGNAVKIRFRGINGYGNNLYLDNIAISETVSLDCNGVPGGTAVPGAPCEIDGLAGIIDADCNCIASNHPPVAVNDSYTTPYNQTLSVNVANGVLANDSDPDGDPILVTIYFGETLGTTSVSLDGSFTYTPNEGVSGTDVITYTITDGEATASATLSITIQPFIDCEGVINGTAVAGTLCEAEGDAGIYSTDCTCEPIPLASIQGSVAWNNACGERGVTIELYNQDFATLNTVLNTTVDATGAFISIDFPSGVYNVRVKIEGFLSSYYSDVIFSEGDNTLAVNALLAGDLDGDNQIGLIDISILNSAYGTLEGDDAFNTIADLNCDGFISLIDFSILNVGYGATGE